MKLFELQARQSWPLELKEAMTNKKIREWHDHWAGAIYVAFSGGRDSTVLLDLVRRIYPDVPAVFCDTGLEYPEIRAFVKTIPNVTWVRPVMSFKEVIERFGYPIISKDQAGNIAKYHQAKTDFVRECRLNGFPNGRMGTISKKWQYLINAPFKISDYCCTVLKERPISKWAKKTGRMGMNGVMAEESRRRTTSYLARGCNAFTGKNPLSMPMAFWTTADVQAYLKKYDVPYSKIYDMGETRTGCMFCGFGAHLEREPNRFQRMALTHHKHWKYCTETLGLREVLATIGVPVDPPKYLF